MRIPVYVLYSECICMLKSLSLGIHFENEIAVCEWYIKVFKVRVIYVVGMDLVDVYMA